MLYSGKHTLMAVHHKRKQGQWIDVIFRVNPVANIKDVARLAGVSISTVSRVVNNSAGVAERKKKAVLRAMSELDYQPNSFAKALVNKKSDTLGIVVGELGDPFFSLLMRGVEKVASEHGKQLLISVSHHNPELEYNAIRSLIERRCDALVVHSKSLADYHIQELLKTQPASVLINRYIYDFSERCIHLDNRKAGEVATEYLINNGHRRIAVLSRYAQSRHLELEDARERFQGYQDALIRHGILPDSRRVVKEEPTEKGGYKATMELLEKGRDFTAVFAYNDAMAAGCLKALKVKQIRGPEEVSVLGFDDVLLAKYLNPSLTTVRYPIEEMAVKAAGLALALAEGDAGTATQNEFEPQVIERESVLQFTRINLAEGFS